MNRLSITLVGCLALLLASASRGESPSETEQSLQKAQARLDCCYRTATAFLAKTGDKENAFALEESQKTWEKYRDADLKFEIGIIDSNDEFGKRLRATILLRLTTERIDALIPARAVALRHRWCVRSDGLLHRSVQIQCQCGVSSQPVTGQPSS